MNVRHVLTAIALLLVQSGAVWAYRDGQINRMVARYGPIETSPIRAAERAAGAKSEQQVRDEIAQRVHSLIMDFKFKELDETEQSYLKSGERTPSGVPKLGEFHAWLQYTLPRSEAADGCPLAADTILKMWEANSPGKPTVLIARAAALVDRAWCFRGDGYATSVQTSAWTPFQENLAAAAKLLTEHKATASEDPEYYVVMEDIYRAQGRDRAAFNSLLNEATTSAPYYYRIYWTSFYYNQPQWFGGDSDIDAAGRYAATRTKAKDGLGAYARYYWYASDVNCSCWQRAVDWHTMTEAMHDVANAYPDPWNLAHFAKIACKMNDARTAKAYFTALGTYDGAEAWQDDPDGLQQCRQMAGF